MKGKVCMDCKFSHNKYGNYCYKFNFPISDQYTATNCKCYKYGTYHRKTQIDPALASWWEKARAYQKQKAKANQIVG